MYELNKDEFLRKSQTEAEKDLKLIEFAYNNLNNIPAEIKGENYERMISGMIYKPFSEDLERLRLITSDKCKDYGKIRFSDFRSIIEYKTHLKAFLDKFMGSIGDDCYLEAPFYFDYGFNTSIGKGFYANYNMCILDVSIVKIGNHVKFGPNVCITTAKHPLDSTLRKAGIESATSITIGDNVWLASNVVVLSGVTIGNDCIVGAGSVVNRSLAAGSVAVGVPARVIKRLDPSRSINLEKEMLELGL